MTATIFLTTEQVVTIALDRWTAHVADLGTVDGAVMACRKSLIGYEPYPTIWEKADCLLRSLSTTQGFVDGNKRVAWTATETFLAINGVFVEPPAVCAHAHSPWASRSAPWSRNSRSSGYASIKSGTDTREVRRRTAPGIST